MDFKTYVRTRRQEFMLERRIKSVKLFSDEEQILLASSGAECFCGDERPNDPWNTRLWLEDIMCVLHHGCCVGCKAQEMCKKLSNPPSLSNP